MSFHERLNKLDDGSFDALVKKIEQQTDDEAERESLLTQTVLHNFMRRCALNAQEDRENTEASESDHVPEILKNYVENIKASEPVFVIRKMLTSSDLSKTQCGLSIPECEINADRFLGEQEIQKLNSDRALPVTLVEIGSASVVETNMRLKKRKSNYLLTEKWNEVKRRNEEKFQTADGVNALIQLWSFRHNSKLYFALNVVEEEARNGVASTNGSNNGGGASTSRSNGDAAATSNSVIGQQPLD